MDALQTLNQPVVLRAIKPIDQPAKTDAVKEQYADPPQINFDGSELQHKL
jgi:hypothetical protein